jgi:hypothetical protein
MKGKTKARANMNHTYEEQIPISEMGEQVAYDVDGEGVLFTTQPTEKNASSLVGKKRTTGISHFASIFPASQEESLPHFLEKE